MHTTTRTRTSARTRLLLATVSGAVLLAGLTACSGGTLPNGDGATAADGPGIGAQWGSCMRAAGFDVQDPSDDQVRSGTALAPETGDREAFATAASTCSADLGVEQVDSAEKDRWTREYARVASCIRDEYPDYPEQQPGGLSFNPEDYPRALEDGFQERADECLAEFSPDTKSQPVG